MDSTTPTPDRIELSSMVRDETGALVHRVLPEAEVAELIDIIQRELDAEQKKNEATSGDI